MNLIYLRVSTEDQNPLNQLKDCRTLIDDSLKTTIIEENQSGWKEDHKRTEFNRVLDLIKFGDVKTLIVWDLDRIYRNRTKLKGFFELCKMYQVSVLSYRQKWLNDLNKIPKPFDEITTELFINLLGWLAEEESNKKSDRVKIAYNNHKGKDWGRPKKQMEYLYFLGIRSDLRKKDASIRKIAEKFKVTKYQVEKIKKEMSEKVGGEN